VRAVTTKMANASSRQPLLQAGMAGAEVPDKNAVPKKPLAVSTT